MVQKQDAVEMSEVDMLGMGMTREEVDAELAKRIDPAKVEAEKKQAEEAKKKEDADKKAAADKIAQEKADKEKNAGVIDDMLFRKERAEKQKAREEAVKKAREELRAKMTPEEIAKENEEMAKTQMTLQERDIENYGLKANMAMQEIYNATPRDEWEIIAPELQKFIDSKDYDEAIAKSTDPEKFTADMVLEAKRRSTDKLTELKVKKALAQKEAETKVEDLKNFNQHKEKGGGGTVKTELELLHEKASKGYMNRDDTVRMIELENMEAAKAKTS